MKKKHLISQLRTVETVAARNVEHGNADWRLVLDAARAALADDAPAPKNSRRPVWRTAKQLRAGAYFICDAHAGSLCSPLPAWNCVAQVSLEIQGRPFRAQLERAPSDYATTKTTRGWVWSLSLLRPSDGGASFHLGPVFLFRPANA